MVRRRPPLDVIRHAQATRRGAEIATEIAVRDARRAGHSWTEIGAALGVPRQNAWRKYHASEPQRGSD